MLIKKKWDLNNIGEREGERERETWVLRSNNAEANGLWVIW